MAKKKEVTHFMKSGCVTYTACGSCLDEGCGCTPGAISQYWKNVTCDSCLRKRKKVSVSPRS